ncbi:MAG: tyrosine-type recombinase/integrase [Nannocystaceae bacterium]|nr:tyrosine-type recombinase/integrase [bacterium]
MSVYKRTWPTKNGTTGTTWMVQIEWRNPDGTRRSIRRKSPIQTKRGAEKYEREVRAALADGSYGKEVKRMPTVAEFAEEFMQTYVKANNKHSTCEDKRSMLRHHLVPFFGRMKLDEIGPREIERYKAAKLRTHSVKTVTNQLSVLRKMLNVAHEWEIIGGVPKFRWMKLPESRFRFLDFDEAERLLDVAKKEPDQTWWTMALVALNTGMRQGELLAIEWDDIDLVAARLVVRRSVTRGVLGTPKSGRNRQIDLNSRVVAALRSHRHLRGPLVFCNEDGSMLTKNQCRRPLRKLQRRAGLMELAWHDLRHTFASHLAMRGVPMKAIQELMGHSTMKMTMRYAHLTPSVRRDAVERLVEPAPQYMSGTQTANQSESGS